MQKDLLLLLSSLILMACSQKPNLENADISPFEYEIRVADSVLINYLGTPLLFDIEPEKRLLFFHDFNRNMNVLMDFEGNTLWEKSFTGDSPNNNGHFLSIASFTDSGFVFLGSRGIGVYDWDGNLISQKRPSHNFLTSFVILNQAAKLEYWGNNWVHRFINAGEFKSNQAEYYTSLKTLALINEESGKVEFDLPLPKDSRFLDGKSYENIDLSALTSLKNEHLWAVFGGDNKLYKFALKDLSNPLAQIEINYPKFVFSKGTPLVEQDPNSRVYSNYGQNELLRTDGKFLMLVYRPGFTSEEQNLLRDYGKIEDPAQKQSLIAEIRQRNNSRIILFDAEGNQVLEMPTQKGWGMGSLIAKNGSFWIKKNPNPEVEEDFFTLYRLELIKTEKKVF
jgi:hypothetical protein